MPLNESDVERWTTLASEALKLILDKFAGFAQDVQHLLTRNNLDGVFRACDQREFMDARMKLFLKPNPPNCTMRGFTITTATWKRVYINTEVAPKGTLVHEWLHYFTHPAFAQMSEQKKAELGWDTAEGVTEHFTRKVLSHNETALDAAADDENADFEELMRRTQFTKQNRDMVYPKETALLNVSLVDIKEKHAKAQRQDLLKRAYFLGDPAAISLLFDELHPELPTPPTHPALQRTQRKMNLKD